MKWLTRWFDDDVDWYPAAGIIIGAYAFYQAISLNRWLIAGWPRPTVLAGVFGLIFGIGVLCKMPGARWWGIPWVLLTLLVPLINGATGGWTAWTIVGAVALAVMAVHFVYTYFFEPKEQPAEEEEGGEKPFLSLVLLFREHRFLDATILASLASMAWDMPVSGSSADDESSDDEEEDENGAFIVGSPPFFMAKHPQAMLVIHHHERPYFDDPAAVAEELTELRVQRAVAEHVAWTAVDVLHWFGDEVDEAAKEATAYRLIARLLAELADDNVLAIIDPAASQLFAYDPETERKLRSENPLAELREPFYAPVICVPDDDPAMLAAVAEARQRWPEFVTAFENRSQDEEQPFTIKAPIGPEGNEEFIWIEVTGIEAAVIYGTLGNQPAGIPGMNLGDRVRVSVDKLNDWLCLIDGKPAGGFTLKVIADHGKRRREEE